MSDRNTNNLMSKKVEINRAEDVTGGAGGKMVDNARDYTQRYWMTHDKPRGGSESGSVTE